MQRCHTWGTALAWPHRTHAPKETPSARDLTPLWAFWIHLSSGSDFPGRKAARCRLLAFGNDSEPHSAPLLCVCVCVFVWSSLSGCIYLPFLRTREAEYTYTPHYIWPSLCCAGAANGMRGEVQVKGTPLPFQGLFLTWISLTQLAPVCSVC